MTDQRKSGHGGNIYQAMKDYQLHQGQIVDYSANINPLGIPESVRKVILSGVEELVNYPDPACTVLKEAISIYLAVPPDRIVIGNGASEMIFLLFEVLGLENVLIPAPAFSEYAKAAKQKGIRVEYFEMQESEAFELDIEGLIGRITDSMDAVVLCNPNNPTSTLIKREELEKLIQVAHSLGKCVIIDEAFIELTSRGNDNSVVDLTGKYDNLFIIRAFTKVFAIPGLRLGYLIGNRQVIATMWEKKLPWSVNTFASNLGEVLSCEKEYLQRTKEWITEEKEWLYRQLLVFSELKVFMPETNFILIKILSDRVCAGALRDRMARNGVLIRDASNFQFLNEKFFRIAIKDRKNNERLLTVLRLCLKAEGVHSWEK